MFRELIRFRSTANGRGTISWTTAWFALTLPNVSGCFLDDQFQGATSTVFENKVMGPARNIIIDNCGGAITIRRGNGSDVIATVHKHSNCKNKSKAFAEQMLQFLSIAVDRQADTLKIKTSRTGGQPLDAGLSASVDLWVPDGVSLDLKTEIGSIWVVGSPREIIARNQLGVLSFQLGHDSNVTNSPTPVLDLEGFHGEVHISKVSRGYTYTGAVRHKGAGWK
jgi:hypothetical protein